MPRRARKARFKLHLEATTLLVQHPFTDSEVSETSLTSARDDISVISRPTRKLSHSLLHPGRSQRSVGAPHQESLLPVFKFRSLRPRFKVPDCKRSAIVMPAKAGIKVHFRFRFVNCTNSGFRRDGGTSFKLLVRQFGTFSSLPRIVPSISDLTERSEGR